MLAVILFANEIEKLFKKCVQRDLDYKLNTNFVT